MWRFSKLYARQINKKCREGQDAETIKEGIPKDEVLRKAGDKVIKLMAYEAYGESLPQAILQAYTLWKRPFACFVNFDFDNCKYLEKF